MRFNFPGELLIQQVNSRTKNENNVSSQLLRYLEECTTIGIDEDIFKWWHTHQKFFPNLYEIAIEHLIIPATSADSERIFSSAGYVLSQKRSRLTGDHVNILIYLNKNKFY